MKIISRNINGIRAITKKNIWSWLDKQKPDIFCIQEPKAFEDQIPAEFLDRVSEYGYIRHKWQRPWYAGTAIFYKVANANSQNHFQISGFHIEWRLTQLEWSDAVLLNFYIPNGGDRADGTSMLEYKLDFYDKVFVHLQDLQFKFKNIILCWDFNICHRQIDIARPEANKNSIWFLPIERQKLDELLNMWFVDGFRYINGDIGDKYTWRSYRAGARPNNIWRRLDYFFVSSWSADQIQNCYHLDQDTWSDHCPIVLELK